jgi:hypothetical protein
VICGAALRRQRREKRLFMAAGILCGQAEIMAIGSLVEIWRQAVLRGVV